MYILGILLPDQKVVRRALRAFYGINYYLAERICARFQIHAQCRVHELTDAQIAALSAYLSSPSTVAPPYRCKRAAPGERPPPLTAPLPAEAMERSKLPDQLAGIRIESEARRYMRENIAHHREIGTYKGRRHAMRFPVRGQKTRTNAKTARKLNMIERRAYGTWAAPTDAREVETPRASPIFQALRHAFWSQRPSL